MAQQTVIMKQTRLIPTSILMAGLALLGVTRAAVPPAEQLLPRDTVAVLGIPNFQHLKEVRAQSAMWRLWNDPAMAPFRKQLTDKFREEVLQPLEQEAGIKVGEYLALLQGQVTLAVTLNGWTGGEDPLPGVLLIMDSGDHAADLRAKLADIRRKISEGDDVSLQTEEIRGTEFFKLAPPEDADAPNVALHFGQVDSLLLASLNAQTGDLEQVLARLAGGSVPSLADQSQWHADKNLVFRDALSFCWIHAAPLVKVAMHELSRMGQNQQGMGPKPDMVANALGLLGLKSIACAGTADASGEQFQLFVGAPQASRKGLLNIPSGIHGDASPPPFVPDNVTSFTRVRLSLGKVWREIENIANAVVPGMLQFGIAQMEAGIKQKDPNFSLQQGIINNFGDDIISYDLAPREKTFEALGTQPSLTLIGSPRAEQLLGNLKTLVETTGSMNFDQNEFLGRKIYSLTIPLAERPDGSPMTFNLCANRGYLALSLDRSILETYLRGAGSSTQPLAAKPGLTQAAETVGGMRTGCFGYQNDTLIMGILVEALRTGGNDFLDLFAAKLPTDTEEAKSTIRDWVDFSLLPPFEQIKKYFSFTVFAGKVRPEGFSVKLFTPAPAGLR
jgi:hypothetical protein